MEHPTVPLSKIRDNFNLRPEEYIGRDRDYLFAEYPTNCNCCLGDFPPEDLMIGKTKCVCGWRTCLGCMLPLLETRYGDMTCPNCRILSLWMHQGTLQTLRCQELFLETLLDNRRDNLGSDIEVVDMVGV